SPPRVRGRAWTCTTSRCDRLRPGASTAGRCPAPCRDRCSGESPGPRPGLPLRLLRVARQHPHQIGEPVHIRPSLRAHVLLTRDPQSRNRFVRLAVRVHAQTRLRHPALAGEKQLRRAVVAAPRIDLVRGHVLALTAAAMITTDQAIHTIPRASDIWPWIASPT